MKKSFKNLCRLYLTDEEDQLLSYEQKVKMINFTASQVKKDREFESFTGRGTVDNISNDLKDIGETVNSLPMTGRQKEIARYRCLDWTIEEIGDLLSLSHRTIDYEIEAIKAIMLDNKELLECEHEAIHKKSYGYDE